MTEVGVPVVPTDRRNRSRGGRRRRAWRARLADEIGYPVLIKAAGGGGGRGMNSLTFETASQLRGCAREWHGPRHKASFRKRFALYYREGTSGARAISRCRSWPTSLGNVIHVLGERDCSLQRRHQKLLEEAGSSVRSTPMSSAAIGSAPILPRNGRAARLPQRPGTLEFLLYERRRVDISSR